MLSSLAGSTKEPNSMTVSITAQHGTVAFCPLALKFITLEAFLPNYSLGEPSAFTGLLVKHGEYEILGKTLYDEKQIEITSIGKVKIPDDFLEKAKIPNDI